MILCKQTYTINNQPGTCDRPSFKDGYCICHYNSSDKPLSNFNDEIAKIKDKPGPYRDLVSFVFPKEFIRFPFSFDKPTFFNNSKFYNDISFQSPFYNNVFFDGTQFYENASFNNVSFQRSNSFIDTTFNKKAMFNSTSLSQNDGFTNTTFLGETSFNFASLSMNPENRRLIFSNCKFIGNSFLGLSTHNFENEISFSNCDLSGVVISSILRNNIKLVIDGDQKWFELNSKRPWKRAAIKDEDFMRNNPIYVVDSYRYLEKIMYDQSNFTLARDFHIGQMVNLRKDKKYGFSPKLANWFYQKASNYGNSIVRPLLFTFIIWLLTPILLLNIGYNIHRSDDPKDEPAWVAYNFEVSNNKEDFKQFWFDYKSAFISNIALSTIDRKNDISPPSDSKAKIIILIETFLIVLYASFLIIAVRRKFTPKLPTHSRK